MNKLITVLLTTGLIVLNFQPAQAHAQLDVSVPKRNEVISTFPPLVWLEFDGDLITFGGKAINVLMVTNSRNQRVDIGGTIVGGARISTMLKSGLAPGKYKVAYRIVSEDGHPVEGSYSFTFKQK